MSERPSPPTPPTKQQPWKGSVYTVDFLPDGNEQPISLREFKALKKSAKRKIGIFIDDFIVNGACPHHLKKTQSAPNVFEIKAHRYRLLCAKPTSDKIYIATIGLRREDLDVHIRLAKQRIESADIK